MGAGMGLFEDALSHHAIGVNGIAKTVVGFLAASVGIRIEVENHIVRLLLNFSLSLLSSVIYFFIYRVSAGPGAGVELADGADAGGGEFADCRRAVSPFGPSADKGVDGAVKK